MQVAVFVLVVLVFVAVSGALVRLVKDGATLVQGSCVCHDRPYTGLPLPAGITQEICVFHFLSKVEKKLFLGWWFFNRKCHILVVTFQNLCNIQR